VRRNELLFTLALSILVTSCAAAPPTDGAAPPPSSGPEGPTASGAGPEQEPTPPPVWSAYSPKDGSFSAQFPGTPEETVSPANGPAGKVDMHQFAVERQSGSAYMASYTDFPNAATSPDDVRQRLVAVRDVAVKSAQATLVNDREITVNGILGREFTASMAIPEVVTTHTRVFMKGGRLFQFMALVPNTLSEEADVRRFLDSIALTP